MTQKPTTEHADVRYRGIDEWPSLQIATAILTAQQGAVAALHNILPDLARAADEAAKRLAGVGNKGRLIVTGAGTPARIQVQDLVELTPTYGWPTARTAFVNAGGDIALTRAVEGAEDDVQAARNAIAALNITSSDVCIAISASGSTPFTVESCRAARAAGAMTIGMASNGGSLLLNVAEYPVLTESGPEPVAGSTRMNAGTSQTVAMKILTTLIMIRLGHVHDGYMVDMLPTNEKLKKRAVQMVQDITGCQDSEAVDALRKSGGNVKLAVLVTAGLTSDEARDLLEKNNNNLRTALRAIRPPAP